MKSYASPRVVFSTVFAALLLPASVFAQTAASAGAGQPAQTVTANGFEGAGLVPSSAILSPSVLVGPGYRIADMTQANGLDNDYTLLTPYGTFTAHGNAMLVRRIKEARAIAILNQMSNSREFGDALAQTGVKKIEDISAIIRNPVGTIKSIPKGLQQFGKRAKEAVTSKKDPRSDSTIDQALSVSKARRELAAALGVDPETDNEVLREQLNRVAWVRAMAGLGLNIAAGQIAPFQVAVGLTVVDTTGKLHEAALTQTPKEVRDAALASLRRLGVSLSTARKLMNNTAFTTLQLADVIDRLTLIGPNPTMGVFVDWMLSADTITDAAFFDGTAALVASYAQQAAPVKRFFRLGQAIAFEDSKGNIVLPAYRDYIIWTQSTASIAARLRTLRQKNPDKPVIVLVSGLVSPEAMKQAQDHGVKLIWGISKQPSILQQAAL